MKKTLFFLLLSLNFAFSQQYLSHEFQNNLLEIQCDWAKFKIIPYTDDIFKVHFYPNGFNDPDEFDIVIAQPETNLEISLEESDSELILKSSKAAILINKYPLRISLIVDGKTLLEADENQWGLAYSSRIVKFKLDDDEAIYGLGGKAVDINRRNLSTVLYNQNIIGYTWPESWLNINIPFILSSNMWGLYFDGYGLNYFSSDIDVENVFKYVIEDSHMSFFMFGGDSYQELLEKYLYVTGSQKMIPLWALGYMQSKFGYYSESDTEYRIYGLHYNGFPVDVVQYDYFWFGSTEAMGDLEWAGSGWIDPKAMTKKFESNGIKSVLISEPYISQKSKNFQNFVDNEYYAVNSKTGTFHYDNVLGIPAVLIDIFNEDASNWIMKLYQEQMLKTGIHGWWLDIIEPELHSFDIIHGNQSAKQMHNKFSFEYAKGMYNMMSETFPERRPFMQYRGGWAGVQRYGMTFQIGDEERSWMGLKSQIPIVIGLSMSGSPWIGTDIGGFFNNTPIYPELHLRWFQVGTFNPIMRMHMYGIADCEPHLSPIEIRDEVKELMKLRYRLLPYNYTLIYENHVFGLPPVRQTDFYHHDNELLHNKSFQFYWGKDFFVAPVIDSGAVTKEVTLPPGKWIDYYTHEEYEGNATYILDAPLEKLPLFVRAGSIIPTAPDMLTTAMYDGDSLIVEYYPDMEYPSSEYKMYDDDGETPDAFAKGEYQLINFSSKAEANLITINLSKLGNTYKNAPNARFIEFKVFSPEFTPSSVTLNGIMLGIADEIETYKMVNNAYYFDSETNILYLKFDWNLENAEIIISDLQNSIVEVFNKIVISPNPIDDEFSISINSLKSTEISIELYDITGKNVMPASVYLLNQGSNIFNINCEALLLPKGIYILKIVSSNSIRIFKIMK